MILEHKSIVHKDKAVYHRHLRNIQLEAFQTTHTAVFTTHLMRVPVWVKDDDSVSHLEVEPKASRSGTEQEDEVRRARGVEELK